MLAWPRGRGDRASVVGFPLGVRDRAAAIVADGQSLRRLFADDFFLLTPAAYEADDVGRETFVAILLDTSERKPRAGSCGVFKADKAARLVGTTEFGCSMRRNASWFLCPSLKHGKWKTSRRRRSAGLWELELLRARYCARVPRGVLTHAVKIRCGRRRERQAQLIFGCSYPRNSSTDSISVSPTQRKVASMGWGRSTRVLR
jgi:hypothetical protein